MGYKENIVSNAEEHLRSGEDIRAAFLAQRSSPWRRIWGTRLWAVVVTEQRVLIFDATGTGKLGSLERELPAGSQFGDPSGLMQARIDVDGDRAWVQRGWWKEVQAANRLGGSTNS